jgi:hypothetical protein
MQPIEVVIGLIFVYLLLSLLATVINEFIANILSLRGRNLRKAIAHMFPEGDGDFKIKKFFDDPYIKKLSQRPIFTRMRRIHSDYLPKGMISDILAKAVFSSNSGVEDVDELEKKIDKMFVPKSETNRILKRFVSEAHGNIEQVKLRIESWYDDIMDLATEWYKSKVRLILLGIGFVICVLVNADTFTIAKRLWVDPAARASMSQMAEGYVESGAVDMGGLDSLSFEARHDSLLARRDRLLRKIETTESVLGMGWGDFAGAGSFWGKVKHVFGSFPGRIWGWLLTTLAISMGAPFWFDILNRVVRLRHGGRQAEVESKKKPTAVG